MAQIIPSARLDVAYDKEYFGAVIYAGDDLIWPLASLIGQPGVSTSNLQPDPTGNYLMQAPYYIPVAADETQWDTEGGTYTHTTHPTTNVAGLWQSDGSLASAGTATFNTPHGVDIYGGFKVDLFRGAAQQVPGQASVALTPDNFNFYVSFNVNSTSPNGPFLSLAIEYGKPICLNISYDGENFTTVAVADQLGDSETYLNSVQRHLVINVLPETDTSWWNSLPESAQVSDQPPDQVVVTLNGGDAVLVWKAQQAFFADGQLDISYSGGQWGCYVYDTVFYPSGSMQLPAQFRAVQFGSQPSGSASGYYPEGNFAVLTPNVLTVVSADASLSVGTTSDGLTNGYSEGSVFLNFATADFPPVFKGRSTGIAYASFYDIADQGVPAICSWSDSHDFYQRDFLVRSSGMVRLVDNLGTLAPGQSNAIGPFIRAAALVRGNVGYDNLLNPYNDTQVGITGLIGGRVRQWWEGKQFYLELPLTDRFRDQKIVGYMPPLDGKCHYYAMRQLGYRLNLTDDWMASFPYCNGLAGCPHYKLPRGTTYEPLFQLQPGMGVLNAMLKVRSVSGDVDLATGQVLPMYLFFDQFGNLIYQAAPVGLVQTWLDPSLSPITQGVAIQAAYSGAPQFSDFGVPALNEFISELGSSTSLDNIRTPIVLEGLSPVDAALVTGTYRNTALDDPNTFGYPGGDMPYYDISYLYSSVEATAFALQIAGVQMSFPGIESQFRAYIQSGLFPLMTVSVTDPFTQGTNFPVSYYTTNVKTWGTQTGDRYDSGTRAVCRVLGQSGA